MGDDREKKKYKKKDFEDITEKVTKAITQGDFSKLNDMVKDTVEDVVEDVVDEIKRISNRPRTNYSSSGGFTRYGEFSPNDRYTGYKKNYAKSEVINFNDTSKNHYKVANQSPFPAKVRFVPKKYGSSLALNIFSWGFLVLFGLGLLSTVLDFALPDAIMMAVLTSLAGVGIYTSGRKLANIKRGKRLYNFIQDRNYITIKEVSSIFMCNEITAKKKLVAILEQGIFPQARFDTSGTTLLLTKESYDNYMYIEKRKQTLLLEEDMEKQKLTGSEAAKNLTDEQKRDWLNVVSEGEDYIQKLRKLNDEIPEEVISNKLDELEKLLREIFDRVKKQPSEANQMRRFMDYYLPTTVKLVDKFKEFGAISSPNKEVLDAKSNIENTIDTINHAFVEMLNNLYKNDIYDVTTDASVIKTMLAKEGLTNDFK